MMGENNSVSSRFKEKFPGIIIINNNKMCMVYAIQHFYAPPGHVKSFQEDVRTWLEKFAHFLRTAKRQYQFVEFQNFLRWV